MAAIIAVTGCGGDNETPELTTASTPAISTATPFAVVPKPTIVMTTDTPAAPSAVTYIVEAGDTLSGIAARFDTTVEEIMANNDIVNATLIFVGQELLIGSSVPNSSGENESTDGDENADSSIYVVRDGDTAWDIATNFGSSLQELADANDVTVDELSQIQPGDKLTLPRPR